MYESFCSVSFVKVIFAQLNIKINYYFLIYSIVLSYNVYIMTYDQILTLDYIVNFGSFKAAAKAMHKSQPSISMSIKKLEEEFNITLFDRTQYRPVLTEEGKKFYKKAIRTIENFKELENLGYEIGAGFETEINICIDAIFPIQKIAHVFSNFLEPHINTSLNLSVDVLEGLYKKIEDNEVDFAIGPFLPNYKSVELVPFSSSKIIPVIAKKYLDKINYDLLQRLPQIVVGSSSKKDKDKISNSISHQFWYVSDMSIKEQLIENGLGWGSLPEHQIKAKLEQGLLIEITEVPQVRSKDVPMYLMRSKTKIMGPNTKRLWDYFVNLDDV